jgi:hypothetical protein
MCVEEKPNRGTGYGLEAAEEADRLGVDIINSSLGYLILIMQSYNHNLQSEWDQ